MNNGTGMILFILGAAVGSVATWQYTKRYYEKQAQEEIDSVKEAFHREKADAAEDDAQKKEQEDEFAHPKLRKNKVVDMRDTSSMHPDWAKSQKVEEKPDISKYVEIMEHEKYAHSGSSEDAGPYVISPDDFGEFDDYSLVSLNYYSDQVLTDENDDVIKDVDDVVGQESLTHFGEYEDDSVFVRNDRLKCDYEILMDTRTYSEVLKRKPHRKEG